MTSTGRSNHPPLPIDLALRDPNLLGAALGDSSTWRTWIAVLKAAFARPLTRSERELFDQVAGGPHPPAKPVRELWPAAGRRPGKSRIAAAIAAYVGTCLKHRDKLAPGERGQILTLSPSKAQADTVHGYCEAFI